MRNSLLTILIIISCSVLFCFFTGSCRKNENPNKLELWQQVIPDSFSPPAYHFPNNPLSKEGFELGRKLFYDGRLSVDNVHPCSSCHQQIAAFGTFEHDRSHGVNNSHTLRNAPVLFNLSWQTAFHWDGEFRTIEEEAAQPITGHIEMGESWNSVIDKLQKDPSYRKQFTKVFRNSFIRPEFILKALAQFTGYLVSADSRYDRYKKGGQFFHCRRQGLPVVQSQLRYLSPGTFVHRLFFPQYRFTS